MSNTASKEQENKKITICCGGFGLDPKKNELVFIVGEAKEMDESAGEIVVPLEGEWLKTKKPRKKNLEQVVKLTEKAEPTKKKPGRPKRTEAEQTEKEKKIGQPVKRGRPRKEKVVDGEER